MVARGWCAQAAGAIVHNFRHVNACVYYSILLLDLFCEEVKSVRPAGDIRLICSNLKRKSELIRTIQADVLDPPPTTVLKIVTVNILYII